MKTHKDKYELLTELLLEEDRDLYLKLSEKLTFLEEKITIQNNLHETIKPILNEEFNAFSNEIPNKLGPVITKTIKVQIEESQDEVVEALYPILGKLIKKYIKNEIDVLTERINSQINNRFSFKNIRLKIKSLFFKINETDLIISDINKPIIQQVFIINKESGILINSDSRDNENIDKDMVAGLLTAIKSFVEDAISEKNQNLEFIEFEENKILLLNQHKCYFAIVFTGSSSAKFKNDLLDIINKNYDVNKVNNFNAILKSLINYDE